MRRPLLSQHEVAGDEVRPSAEKESLSIPAAIRAQVDERDQMCCRMCGKYLGDARAIHHIIFGGDARGMGGRRQHRLEELITLCWMWGGNCHDRAHHQKHKWTDILLYCATRRGVTAFQVSRWQAAQQRKRERDGQAGDLPRRGRRAERGLPRA